MLGCQCAMSMHSAASSERGVAPHCVIYTAREEAARSTTAVGCIMCRRSRLHCHPASPYMSRVFSPYFPKASQQRPTRNARRPACVRKCGCRIEHADDQNPERSVRLTGADMDMAISAPPLAPLGARPRFSSTLGSHTCPSLRTWSSYGRMGKWRTGDSARCHFAQHGTAAWKQPLDPLLLLSCFRPICMCSDGSLPTEAHKLTVPLAGAAADATSCLALRA